MGESLTYGMPVLTCSSHEERETHRSAEVASCVKGLNPRRCTLVVQRRHEGEAPPRTRQVLPAERHPQLLHGLRVHHRPCSAVAARLHVLHVSPGAAGEEDRRRMWR